jgi:hypothetical protein
MTRREFFLATATTALFVLIPAPQPPTLKLFRVNDWIFIAAADLDAAKAFYSQQGWETDFDSYNETETCEEGPLTMTVQMGEEPDSPRATAQEIIDAELAAGNTAPFIVCFDSHYC